LAAALLPVASRPAFAQGDEQQRRQELLALIHCAPIAPGSPARCAHGTFGRRAEELLTKLAPGDTGRFFRPGPDKTDSLAVEVYYADSRYWLGELEDALQREGVGYVTATVQSTPKGLNVLYRRAVELSVGPQPSITTNTTKLLQPAWYVFTAVDPKTRKPMVDPRTKEPVEKLTDCATNCLVTLP
jgi:hypothetical protein